MELRDCTMDYTTKPIKLITDMVTELIITCNCFADLFKQINQIRDISYKGCCRYRVLMLHI